MHNIPNKLFYTKHHTWIEDIGAGTFKVGITDFAQEQLGDIVYVSLPKINTEYKKDKECATIESVKSTSDIYCPLSGVIKDINSSLEDSPELINSEPYSKAWLFTICADLDCKKDMFIDANAYEQLIK